MSEKHTSNLIERGCSAAAIYLYDFLRLRGPSGNDQAQAAQIVSETIRHVRSELAKLIAGDEGEEHVRGCAINLARDFVAAKLRRR
jgi:hypothetical protein